MFESELPVFYHYYRLVHEENTDRVIDGLHLIFVELPKFSPHTYSEKKMQVLWLRYLTEINENTREVPEDLIDNPEVKKLLMHWRNQLLPMRNCWDMKIFGTLSAWKRRCITVRNAEDWKKYRAREVWSCPKNEVGRISGWFHIQIHRTVSWWNQRVIGCKSNVANYYSISFVSVR